jgi:hypothetical protein
MSWPFFYHRLYTVIGVAGSSTADTSAADTSAADTSAAGTSAADTSAADTSAAGSSAAGTSATGTGLLFLLGVGLGFAAVLDIYVIYILNVEIKIFFYMNITCIVNYCL